MVVNTIVVRGSTGVCVWVEIRDADRNASWQCTRDSFTLAVPADPTTLEAFLVSMAQHSQSLVGTIAQVVQLVI